MHFRWIISDHCKAILAKSKGVNGTPNRSPVAHWTIACHAFIGILRRYLFIWPKITRPVSVDSFCRFITNPTIRFRVSIIFYLVITCCVLWMHCQIILSFGAQRKCSWLQAIDTKPKTCYHITLQPLKKYVLWYSSGHSTVAVLSCDVLTSDAVHIFLFQVF